MAIKKASFPSTHTVYFDSIAVSKSVDDHSMTISNTYNGLTNGLTYMIFSWDFSDIAATYPTITSEIAASTIVSVSVQFWHNLSNDFVKLHVLDYIGGNPFSQSAATIATRISDTVLASYDLINNQQTLLDLVLDDANSFYDNVLSRIGTPTQPVVVTVARDATLTDNDGNLQIGGQTLIAGGANWDAAGSSDVASPPLLIIEYSTTAAVHPSLSMRFTTTDPTTDQDTPSQSLGSYLADNEIYPYAYLAEPISSTQTVIEIADSSDMPDTTGLASVGPEIFRYASINSTEHKLYNITRAIAPFDAFPAGNDAYQIAERVYYLHPDATTGLNLLFDTIPYSNLIQYRCVAILNAFTSDNFAIKNVSVGLAQNTDNDVQIDIGIEVPQFDAHTGTADAGTTTSLIVDAQYSSANGFSSGYFDGAAIKVLSGINLITTVESFDDGEFILADTIAGLTTGTNYVIYPAPSQAIANDSSGPSLASGRFYGFLSDGGESVVSLLEHETIMYPYDCFYLWIKRTFTANSKAKSDTGAVIIIRFEDV